MATLHDTSLLNEGVTHHPSASGIPVNYGPASRIPLNFEMESKILIDKKVKEKSTSVLQYFRSLELSMETFPVGAGDVLSVVCEKHELMAVFGYTCELITQLKPKQQ